MALRVCHKSQYQEIQKFFHELLLSKSLLTVSSTPSNLTLSVQHFILGAMFQSLFPRAENVENRLFLFVV
jgi:hypothetical protein